MGKMICQSCGMPMDDKTFGTNADGTQNHDYCKYCYKNGKFTQPNFSMEDMIRFDLKFLDQMNKVGGTNYTPEEAEQMMREIFPTLKRWKEKS